MKKAKNTKNSPNEIDKKEKINESNREECNCEALAKRVAELEEQLKRALADYANFQRDNEKRTEMVLDQLKAKSAGDIITILDDLKYAQEAKSKIEMSNEVGAWVDGILNTIKKIEETLIDIGISPMNVKEGDSFDSSIHEALGVVFEGQDGTINKVVQDGYTLTSNGMVVRPARVIVNRKQ